MQSKAPAELYRERFYTSAQDVLGALHDLYVYLDGRFLRRDEAAVSVWEHCFLYGDGVFEGIRAYDGRVFKLDEHLSRLFESAKSLDLTVPLSKKELSEVVLATFAVNGLKEGHMRLTVTRGVGTMGLNPRNCKACSVVAMAYPFAPLLGSKAVRLITSTVRRRRCDSVDAKIKSANYLENILAKIQSNEAKYDDALMLDHNGYVAEATAMNIFVRHKEKWSTPTTVACLDGVTRQLVVDLLQNLGASVAAREISLHELYIGDEVFCTGTGAEIVPVESVDGRMIGDGASGRVTRTVIKQYRELTRDGVLIPKSGFVSSVGAAL